MPKEKREKDIQRSLAIKTRLQWVGISGAGLRLVDSGAPNDCKIFVRRSKYCLEFSIN